jgi:hypothetical protein
MAATAAAQELGYIRPMSLSLLFFPPVVRARPLNVLRQAMAAIMLPALFAAGSAFAQQAEVFTLKHRPASDVVGVIRPLVEPAGSVSAIQDKLVVRTTVANLVQVKKVVAALDVEPRRLLVSVRQDSGNNSAPGRVYSTRSADSDRGMQQVQVLEGGRAFVQTGSSVPVTSPTIAAAPGGVVVAGNTRFRDLNTGFFVTPRLTGDTVTVEISAHRDAPANVGAAAGSRESQTVITTVSGRLGEWIRIGGTGPMANGGSGDGSHSWSTSSGERQLLLKVEERN